MLVDGNLTHLATQFVVNHYKLLQNLLLDKLGNLAPFGAILCQPLWDNFPVLR